MKRGFLILGAAGLAALIALQSFSLQQLRDEIRILETKVSALGVEGKVSSAPSHSGLPAPSLGSLPNRVAQLEKAVSDLGSMADHLVQRGNVPPSSSQMERLQVSFLDPAANERDRLRALRLLRRNGELSEAVVSEAMALLQSSTNANTRRDLLRELDGAVGASAKEPLLKLLVAEGSSNVREELVDVLGDFANDSAVEKRLWELALNDPDEDVREQAEDALSQGRVSPERLQALKDKAIDPEASLNERLLALNTLREEDAAAPDVVSEMINLAQNLTDPVSKARLFGALEGVRDPNLMPTLVHGLSDADPTVRENAVEALRPFASDPRVREWLNFVLKNDNDSRVKREAHEILARQQQGR